MKIDDFNFLGILSLGIAFVDVSNSNKGSWRQGFDFCVYALMHKALTEIEGIQRQCMSEVAKAVKSTLTCSLQDLQSLLWLRPQEPILWAGDAHQMRFVWPALDEAHQVSSHSLGPAIHTVAQNQRPHKIKSLSSSKLDLLYRASVHQIDILLSQSSLELFGSVISQQTQRHGKKLQRLFWCLWYDVSKNGDHRPSKHKRQDICFNQMEGTK